MQRVTNHPILQIPEERKLVKFNFNGQELQGYEGEMVSSALISNGIKEFSLHRRGDAPQGIFCANGQCSHCTVIIDGFPLKSCVTPLEEGMDVRTLKHLPELPPDDRPFTHYEKKIKKCDVVVIGGGPSGLTASIELAKLGFKVILVDDKEDLGGKLLLQTHKFFGSIEDCYAGTRGIDIAKILEADVSSLPNIEVLTGAAVIGVFKDRRIGVFVNNKDYLLIEFEGMIVSAGAREKSLVFPGNDLPGVYGAGAFQTLVNRDLVRSSKRVFIVGSGNVGLIAAYHALQAGITAVGICDILDKVSGYKVHADKIQRMGVPIYLSHTVLSAEGDGKVEKITIARVDKEFNPILESARTFEVDTLLIAVGLSPVDECYDMAEKFGFKVLKAGDAEEIAEASSAMFGGRLSGIKMASMLGKNVELDKSYKEKAEILKSKPGRIYKKHHVTLNEKFQPILHCTEEIPCNPCISVCPKNSIKLEENLGNIMDIPYFEGECSGCKMCVAVCPGLAITLARKLDEVSAEVVLPHEFIPDFSEGDYIPLMDQEGNYIQEGEVLSVRRNKRYKTYLISVKTSLENGDIVAGIRVQDPSDAEPLPEPSFNYIPDEGIVCHCEMVTVKEVVDFIKENNVTDINQLKLIRVGMGSCGGKNCSIVLPSVFRKAGVDWNKITKGTVRPLFVEMPMSALVNENANGDEE